MVESDSGYTDSEAHPWPDINACLAIGRLPNGDRLVLNPDDRFVYQIDSGRQVVLCRFCSAELWHQNYEQFFSA